MAVLVSGEGTNLQAILDSVHGHDGIEIACVGSSRPGASALERARSAGIETEAFAASDYASREQRDEALGDWLFARGVELVVLAGFMELLSPAFVRRFGGRLINVHPSLLPAFGGIRAIERALEHGVKVMGVTVHYVDEGVDSGPVIAQRAFELPSYAAQDIDVVEGRIHEIEHELLPQVIRLCAQGRVSIDPEHPRQVLIAPEDAGDGGGAGRGGGAERAAQDERAARGERIR